MKDKPGYFIQPTVLSGMSKNSVNWGEETFAPVVALYKFDTEEEVLELANDSNVGLGSYVITSDIARMYRVVEELEVGMVGVNQGLLSASESPFGGVKESGFGREGGREGIEEYLFTKSVIINLAA
jgi:succinate-semialdehyde dehydrogenase / glutarate-semialdehyde dehydrogenase